MSGLERIEPSSEHAALVARASEAIVLLDESGRVRTLNPAAERLFGREEAHARGCAVGELVGDACAALDAAFARCLAEGDGSLELGLPPQAPGAPPRALEVRLARLSDEGGRPGRVALFASDVTERNDLRRAALREERQVALGELAGGIAHDLNNLLTPILSDAAFLREFLQDPTALEALDGMSESATRAAGVVKLILSFARGSTDARAPAALGPLLEQTARMLRETLPPDVALELVVDPALHDVLADPGQLDQIVLNLCVNARDAVEGGGTIRVHCRNIELDPLEAPSWPELQDPIAVELVVEDTGRGIPPDLLPRIFEPFFTTKAEGRGTGLGLATVRRIVQAHRGAIRVESRRDAGTRFTIRLPATPACTSLRPLAAPEPCPGAGEAVLVVEDEAALRAAFVRTLRRAGYLVLEAQDGVEALAILGREGERLRLVVLDLWMPALDGRAVLRVLRRMRPSVRVVLATGEPFDRDLPLEELAGAGELLRKPFGARALLEATQRQLAHRPEPAAQLSESPTRGSTASTSADGAAGGTVG